LALRASPGADAADPKAVGHENVSGLFEDDFDRDECRIRVSPANVLALRATRFAWTDAAERLAAPVAPPAAAVEAVRRAMAELARHDCERRNDLLRRLGDAGQGSAEAEAIAAELRTVLLGNRPGACTDAGPPGVIDPARQAEPGC
jgi:hypothetical protein